MGIVENWRNEVGVLLGLVAVRPRSSLQQAVFMRLAKLGVKQLSGRGFEEFYYWSPDVGSAIEPHLSAGCLGPRRNLGSCYDLNVLLT